MVLNLGSGSNPMPGAINVDINPIPGVDVVGDANCLPFAARTFTEVHAINPHGFHPVSLETARVMQPGSLLSITGTTRNSFARPLTAAQSRLLGFEIVVTTNDTGPSIWHPKDEHGACVEHSIINNDDISALAMNTIEDVMESVFARRAANLPARALADIFDQLTWCLDDNGAEIEVVRRKWMEGEDTEKIAIALAMTEVFPGEDREEMNRLFQRITARWPKFQQTCQEILNRWDAQQGSEPAAHHAGR